MRRLGSSRAPSGKARRSPPAEMWPGGTLGRRCQFVFLDCPLDPLCGGDADALVDRVCLRQVRCGLAGVAILQVAMAESFQGTRFVEGGLNVLGDGQRLAV